MHKVGCTRRVGTHVNAISIYAKQRTHMVPCAATVYRLDKI